MSPNVNYGLLVKRRFTDCNKCTIVVGVAIVGEAMPAWRQGYMGTFCTFH